jgi:hypothetical protein
MLDQEYSVLDGKFHAPTPDSASKQINNNKKVGGLSMIWPNFFWE